MTRWGKITFAAGLLAVASMAGLAISPEGTYLCYSYVKPLIQRHVRFCDSCRNLCETNEHNFIAYTVRALLLLVKSPEIDAHRAVTRDDFRISAVSFGWGWETPGIACTPRVHDRDIIKVFQGGDIIWNSAHERYREALYDYTERYNKTLMESAKFSLPTNCQPEDGSTD